LAGRFKCTGCASAFGISAETLALGELPLMISEARGASSPFRRSCFCHVSEVFLLQIGSRFVQIRCLIVRSSRTQMSRQCIAATSRRR
jgi:hypothetical protein